MASNDVFTDAAANQAVPWLKKEPLLAALLAADAPLVASFIAGLDGKSTTTTILIGAVLFVLNAAGLAAREATTPVAAPKAADGTPLKRAA